MTNGTVEDRGFMAMALRLAARGLGRVAPNPAVGCVLVKDGRVLARGWTQPGGRPHAETEALKRAGDAARGATAYVTLEPCAHHGKTPPCADALVAAGISRVVVAVGDPDPRTAGKGIARLEAAGIETEVGVLAQEAADLNRGFLSKVQKGRPMVSLKIAQSLDGRIASVTGHSQWITAEDARAHGHLLRARYDAILVGSGTAKADHPRLDCRLPGLEDRSPQRILLCSEPPQPVPQGWWCTKAVKTGADKDGGDEDEAVMIVSSDERGRPSLPHLLDLLAERGITRLLVEGGAQVVTAFLAQRLFDRLYLYSAPKLIGGDGLAAIGSLGVTSVADDAVPLNLLEQRALGHDRLCVYEYEKQ